MSANKLILPAKLVLMLAQFFLVLLIAYIRVSNHFQKKTQALGQKALPQPSSRPKRSSQTQEQIQMRKCVSGIPRSGYKRL